MANMSYCRFQNTTLDLQDCISAIEEAFDDGLTIAEFIEDLGKEEYVAYKNLLKQASSLLELVEENI
jgi:hypothetical protein